MPKENQFVKEYKAICARLNGLSHTADRPAIEQLKNGKAEICRSWQTSCVNSKQYRAELAQAQFEMLDPKEQEKGREAHNVHVNGLLATSKMKQKGIIK